MMSPEQETYCEGQRAARKAIASEIPRILSTEGRDEEMIDPSSGLPFATLTAPPDRAQWLQAFARGYNDTILRAVESGEVIRDFRPLLLKREEVKAAFRDHLIGTLSLDSRRLEDPGGRFVLHLDIPKLKKASRTRTPRPATPGRILIDLVDGECDRTLLHYDSPVEAAVAHDGRVVLIKTACLYLSLDVETTQVLNNYRF